MKYISIIILTFISMISFGQNISVDKIYLKTVTPFAGKWINAATSFGADSATFKTNYSYKVDTTAQNKMLRKEIAAATTGLLDYRGTYNASLGVFPSTGGSGTGGALLKGDWWTVSTEGTIGGVLFTLNSKMFAKVDAPAQLIENWDYQTTTSPAIARVAGDLGIGYLKYNGAVAVNGALDGGSVLPTLTSKTLNVNAHLKVPALQAYNFGSDYGAFIGSLNGISLKVGSSNGASTADIVNFTLNSVVKASIDYTGKLTANGANFGTNTGIYSHIYSANTGGGVGQFITNTGSGIGFEVTNTVGVGFKLQAGGSGNIFEVDSGGAVSNRVKIESDGTLIFSNRATVFEDENIDPTTLTGGGSLPTSIIFASTTTHVAAFSATGTNQVESCKEVPHKSKLAAPIYFHCHWYPTTTNTGVARYGLEYFFTREGVAVTTSTTIYVEIAASGTAWAKQSTNFAAITPPNELGSQFHFRFFRDGSHANDTYTGDAAVSTIGFHYEIDQLGSKTLTTK